MMKRKAMALAALVLTTTVALSGCAAGGSDPGEGSPSVLNVATAQFPAKWDPATFDWGYPLQLQQAVYETLIRQNPDGSFAPGLATEWEYTSPTEFVLTLREGVVFTDGETLDADAVKANFDHFMSATGPKTQQLAAVESVTAEDDDTVVLSLSEPNPALEYTLSQVMGMMASPAALEDIPSLELTPVGAGPYVLDEARTIANDRYTLTKNPDYWDADSIGFDTLVFKVITDQNAALNALRAGDVAIASGAANTVDAARSAQLEVIEYEGGVNSIMLQDREGTMVPALADQRVRQALNYAVDREAIAGSVLPGRPTSQQLGPATEAYDPELDHYYDYDLEKAKELIAESGFPEGFTLPVLTAAVPPTLEPLQAIAANLAEIGVTVEIVSKPVPEFISERIAGTYPSYFGPNTPTNAFLDTQNWILPTAPHNPFGVEDEEINTLFAASASSIDPEERVENFQKLSAAVVEKAWFLPVVQGSAYYYYDPAVVTGVQTTFGQIAPFIHTWQPAD